MHSQLCEFPSIILVAKGMHETILHHPSEATSESSSKSSTHFHGMNNTIKPGTLWLDYGVALYVNKHTLSVTGRTSLPQKGSPT